MNQNKVKQIKRRGKTQKRSQVKNAKWGEKESKKIDQKDPMNKNDLDNSERIWEVKSLCKSQKIDSELSLKKDGEEFLKTLKGKGTSLCPTGN